MLQLKKIMFLWNFHHLFLVLFYQWNNYNQVLITVSDFLGHFSKNHLLEGGYTFQWGVCFWIGGISRGMPQWHALDLMKGFSKKNHVMWNHPPPIPSMGNPENDGNSSMPNNTSINISVSVNINLITMKLVIPFNFFIVFYVF